MKQIKTMIFVLCSLLLLTSANAYAIGITASHQILSVQPTVNGNDITINLTIANQSAQNISYATVEYADAAWQVNTDTAPLKLNAIASGSSTVAVWTLQTGLSSFDGTLPLTIHLFYGDANGNQVDITTTSVVR